MTQRDNANILPAAMNYFKYQKGAIVRKTSVIKLYGISVQYFFCWFCYHNEHFIEDFTNIFLC